MKTNFLWPGRLHEWSRQPIAIVCALLLLSGTAPVFARQAQQPTQAQQPSDQTVKIPPDQLDALVAPIALYPDPLLSQTLVASTYPLEIIQLQQWLEKNPNLKDQALVNAVEKQPWDPSIQAMAALPQVVKRLADDIQWTTDLGNAFLAQQSDVMNAIQRMRVKAQDTGALQSNNKQTVQTEVINDKSVVVIEQAQPEVVYVPEYNPVAVYGAPVYPYPSIYYPPYTAGGVLAASAISWGVGVAMGAAWGGGWGWGAGWGHNDIDMNFNNSFNRNANLNNINRNNLARGGNTWQHNPQHRGGAPYSNRATANRFGGQTGNASLANRQKGAQQQIARQKGNLGSVGNRSAAGGGAGGLGARSGGNVGGGNRSVGGANRNVAGGNRSVGGGLSSRGGGNFGGANSIGNRSVGSSGLNRGGFSGGSGGYSGSRARASSSRGASSFSGRSGGGRSRGGGGGGRSRGGGGGRSRGGGGRR